MPTELYSDESDIGYINPFRYRGYYYDSEISLYYLQSRYYDPRGGRFLNADMPEFGMIEQGALAHNLFAYCGNDCVDDVELSGHISKNSLANLFSASTLFTMFFYALYANKAKGLIAVGSYATKTITPIAVKAFWWKPWAAAAIIVAAVAIVITAVSIYFSNRTKEIDKAKKKIPNKLIKKGKVDLSQFNNKLPNGQGYKGPNDWKIVKDTAKHAAKKWKLYKNKERIASLLEDGTIYGK